MIGQCNFINVAFFLPSARLSYSATLGRTRSLWTTTSWRYAGLHHGRDPRETATLRYRLNYPSHKTLGGIAGRMNKNKNILVVSALPLISHHHHPSSLRWSLESCSSFPVPPTWTSCTPRCSLSSASCSLDLCLKSYPRSILTGKGSHAERAR